MDSFTIEKIIVDIVNYDRAMIAINFVLGQKTNQDFFSGKNLDDWGFCPLECVLHMFTMEIG